MRILPLLLAGATFVAGNASAATNAEKARATAEAMKAGGGPGGTGTCFAKTSRSACHLSLARPPSEMGAP